MGEEEGDCLGHIEAFLSRRDGIDKILKICRYSSKLALSSAVLRRSAAVRRRLSSFESSLSLSRKAFRCGKFVQNINSIRELHKQNLLQNQTNFILFFLYVSSSSELVYAFLDQFVFLSKSGLLPACVGTYLRRLCASAELISYFCNVCVKIRDLRLICGKEGEEARRKIVMKKVSIVQDFADGFIAADDVFDVSGFVISSPLFLSCCGLISAIIGCHKNWISS